MAATTLPVCNGINHESKPVHFYPRNEAMMYGGLISGLVMALIAYCVIKVIEPAWYVGVLLVLVSLGLVGMGFVPLFTTPSPETNCQTTTAIPK